MRKLALAAALLISIGAALHAQSSEADADLAVFNHPQRAVDDSQNLNITFANGVQTNANLGVLPTDNKYGRRIVQLAFKFYF